MHGDAPHNGSGVLVFRAADLFRQRRNSRRRPAIYASQKMRWREEAGSSAGLRPAASSDVRVPIVSRFGRAKLLLYFEKWRRSNVAYGLASDFCLLTSALVQSC